MAEVVLEDGRAVEVADMVAETVGPVVAAVEAEVGQALAHQHGHQALDHLVGQAHLGRPVGQAHPDRLDGQAAVHQDGRAAEVWDRRLVGQAAVDPEVVGQAVVVEAMAAAEVVNRTRSLRLLCQCHPEVAAVTAVGPVVVAADMEVDLHGNRAEEVALDGLVHRDWAPRQDGRVAEVLDLLDGQAVDLHRAGQAVDQACRRDGQAVLWDRSVVHLDGNRVVDQAVDGSPAGVVEVADGSPVGVVVEMDGGKYLLPVSSLKHLINSKPLESRNTLANINQ